MIEMYRIAIIVGLAAVFLNDTSGVNWSIRDMEVRIDNEEDSNYGETEKDFADTKEQRVCKAGGSCSQNTDSASGGSRMSVEKVYVDVTAKFSKEGELQPLTVIWTNGHVYEIQRVIDVRRAASLKAGGVGLRYTCIIDGKQMYLFYEDNNMWFVEGKAGA